MLDRKIKDRNASVELLTDRIKLLAQEMAGIYLCSILFIGFAGLYYGMTWTVGIPMFSLCAAMVGMGGFFTLAIIRNNMELLLYFKEQGEK